MHDLYYVRPPAAAGDYGAFNDIAFTPLKEGSVDFVTVAGSDRVAQDLTKALLTPVGLLPYPNYGTTLASSINTRYSGVETLDAVQQSIYATVYYLVYRETSTELDEQIYEISQLDVSYLNRGISVDLTVTLKSGVTVPLGLSV